MKPLAIAWKDFQIFFKDRGAVFQLILLPLLFAAVMSGALNALGGSGEADTRVALPVVDLDRGATARAFLAGIDAAGGVRVEPYEESTALPLLREGDIGFLLTVPAGFTAAVSAQQPTTLHLSTHPDASRAQVETVRLVVEGVAREMALQTQILAALRQMGDMQADEPPEWQAAFSVENVQAQARSQFERSRSTPLVGVTETVPDRTGAKTPEETSSGGMLSVPGFSILFVFLAAQTTARSIYDEKKNGSFRRLLAAPVSKLALLAGKMLPNLLIAVVQMAVIFAFGFLGLPLIGQPAISFGPQPAATVLVLLVLAVCSTSLGIVIAALARTENQIGGFATLLLWLSGIIGGCMIPIFVVDRFLGPLPKVVPHYWANRALNDLMIRGAGLSGVALELAVLLGFTVLFLAIGLWRFEYD